LIPRFMGEFEPKIIGKMISFKLLPERSYFTKKMIDIMQTVKLAPEFTRKYRINAKPHGSHPYWNAEIKIYLKKSLKGKLKVDIIGTFNPRFKNTVEKIEEISRLIQSLFH
ncbi:MAG: hypothetical protein ACTSRP_09345, partial [Candidatus Helarchaeota archaeon]